MGEREPDAGDDDVDVVSLGDDPEATREVVEAMKDALNEPECRICGYEPEGDSLGEVLEDLGRHGEKEHPEEVR